MQYSRRRSFCRCNAQSVGDFYVKETVYTLGGMPGWIGREAIAGITDEPGHLKLVGAGCAHMSSLPYIVIEGDRAIATCHTIVPMHGENGSFIGRLSASRTELAWQDDGGWKIVHRQNYMLDGKSDGPTLLGWLREGARKL